MVIPVNYVRLDDPGLTADPRAVSEGYADGVHWTIRAEYDGTGVLSTVVTYTSRGVAASFSVLGASLHNGQLLSMWVGRERDARPFLLLRTAPLVTRATAVLASGDRHEVALSPVIENFRLRFGGKPRALHTECRIVGDGVEESPALRIEMDAAVVRHSQYADGSAAHPQRQK